MLLLLQHFVLALLPWGQAAPPARPTFDVVSVKTASPNRPGGRIVIGMTGREGGPGTGDPGRVRYAVICLKFILFEAYGHEDLRIAGPGWLDDTWFQIDATLPPNTTESQFQSMMQNLLADRFKLACHRETKDVTAYSLVVAKAGPKMKEPAGEPGRNRISVGDAEAHLAARYTMARLAGFLTNQLGVPVTDATGFTATYDVALDYSRNDSGTLPDLVSALQSQLGLKLEPKKGSIQTLVIDHIEKTPTEN